MCYNALMLAIQTQPVCAGRPKYIKRAVQLPNGAWALVVFELVEINGKITAKAVCGKLLSEKPADAKSFGETKEKILSLPIYFESENIAPVVSPFFARIENLLKDLSFVISQQPRAPSFL